MVSRLLSVLDARIAKTREPLQHACLSAERATLLARQGRLAEASAELERIRARHAAKPNAVVTAWVCLGEGMVAYFSDLGGSARDRIRRSFALSAAVQAKSLAALSSAWLAQMDFAALDFGSLLQHLAFALQNAELNQHSARARACLVAAETFHWAERSDLARSWYSRARQHAVAEGDESMLSALMHNMAWFRVTELRRKDIATNLSASETRQAHLGTESIHQFDGLVGISSLASLVPMLRAQVSILESDFDQALTLLDANIEGFLHLGLERLECVVRADAAWCHLRLGNADGARSQAQLAISSISPETHADDRAMTYSRAARIHSELGEETMAKGYLLKSEAAWRTHKLQQEQLIPQLQATLKDL